MSEQIVAMLRKDLDDLVPYGNIAAETRRNKLKEILQYYVLNFIYHHPKYNEWTMYGGSALRIIHGLDRMSVDLDFETAHEIKNSFLDELKDETEKHFSSKYAVKPDFLTVKKNNERGVTLKFRVGQLVTGLASEWVDVKIDLNRFIAPKTVTEHRPINRGQLSFVISTYNMGALMASKIAAIFLREQRGVDKNTYDYKGRDIYDLLWYMSKKTVPDFDYLNAKLKEKNLDVPNIKTLFDKLTVSILNYEKMDNLLKEDLSHLFENPFQFDGWFKNWRDSYLRFLNEYKINTVTTLAEGKSIQIYQHFQTSNFSLTYTYNTEEGKTVRIRYIISDYWVIFNDVDVPNTLDSALEDKIEFTSDGWSSNPTPEKKLKRYAALFHEKTEKYFKKTTRVLLGNGIITKVIRMTADNLNPKEEIVLNKSALLSCELDDLLK